MSEINIPERHDYKAITPFRLFVKSNFPFIESTYEALDNYGLYCKVVEYLNQVIDEQNKVNADMVTFTDFVTNYFENLDVQEEINNKIDEMTEDGTLVQFLNSIIETNYTPIIQQQNSRITEISEEVARATSGSPKGVYNTYNDLVSANPSHDHIYVVLATGNWYFYNDTNSTWTSGGQYQASIENDFLNDIAGAYNDCIIKNESPNLFTTTEIDTVDSKIYNTTTGNLGSGDYPAYVAYTNYIEIEGSEKYYFAIYNGSTNNFYSLCPCIVCFYDENKTYITGSGLQVLIDNQPVTAPSTAKYLRLSVNKDYLKNRNLSITKTTYPSQYIEHYEPYYTINPDAITSNLPKNIVYNEIVVDANGGGDYTTLQGAFTYINNRHDNTFYNRYKILIKDGQYNTGANLQPSDYDNPLVSGLFIPNYCFLIGVGNKEDIVLYCTCSTKQQYISTLNLSGTCGIENLTVIGTKTRYCIHADTSQTTDYEHTIKNCIIKGVDTYFSVVYGSGTFDNAHWKFIDTIFDGTEVANNSDGICFTVHNSLNAHANRFIEFNNCRFITNSQQKNAVMFKSMIQRNGTSDASNSANNMQTYVSLYGNKFGEKGFSLTEENNEIYGSGCMYYVSGYGNKNDMYEIITTDSHDYSNRVNLL